MRCSICSHPQLELIDDSLQLVGHFRQAARVFGLSKDALRRHFRRHVAQDRQPRRTLLEAETVLYGEAEARRLQAQRECWAELKRKIADGSLVHRWENERRAVFAVAEAERRRKEKGRNAYRTCRCSAYGFPHKRGGGLCCWPHPPAGTWRGVPGKPSPANLRRRREKKSRDILNLWLRATLLEWRGA